MYIHAVINKDHKVINSIIWDGISPWQPPKDHYVIRDDERNHHINDIYDPIQKVFIPNPVRLGSKGS